MAKGSLAPYDPAGTCPMCQAEGAVPSYHPRPLLLAFGRGSAPPCTGADEKAGEHMCVRCSSCGYEWMAAASG